MSKRRLKIDNLNELLVIDILSIILILVISVFHLQVLRIILGLPFILFFPGYTLIAALFPKKGDLDSIERVALSFGLSIAVIPLIGLALNYTPWGIRLYPILLSLTFFIFAMSGIAWYRRRRLSDEERLKISFNLSFSSLFSGEKSNKLDKVLSIVLVLAILGAIVTLIYVIATPKVGEKFTEFYILGMEGKAENYPKELAVGEEGKVILGIVNHEHKDINYWVEIRIENEEVNELGPILLTNKEKWEKEESFAPQDVCGATKLTQYAYQDDKSIQVASVEHLNAGDYIWIEPDDERNSEFVQIEAVDGNVILLKEALKHDHPPSSEVVEKEQKVEFFLLKEFNFKESEENSSLLLWLGKERAIGKIINGEEQGNYRIEIKESEEVVGEDGPLVLKSGEEKEFDINYRFQEEGESKGEIEFLFYKNEVLLHEEVEKESYPSLHLWIEVSKSASQQP